MKQRGRIVARMAAKSGSRRAAQNSMQRLEARVPAEQKLFFKRAASLRGVSLTDFMIDSMREAAVKAVEEHELMKLGAKERKVFVEALLSPPAPNKALRLATKRYKQMVAG